MKRREFTLLPLALTALAQAPATPLVFETEDAEVHLIEIGPGIYDALVRIKQDTRATDIMVTAFYHHTFHQDSDGAKVEGLLSSYTIAPNAGTMAMGGGNTTLALPSKPVMVRLQLLENLGTIELDKTKA
jgi:hypothetical protein